MTLATRLFGASPARLPPRDFRLDDYKRWFPTTGDVFLRNLKRWHALPVGAGPSEGPAAGVVVMPWVNTPMPWYCVMLGLGLAQRGRPVVFIWDDMPFPDEGHADQNRTIGRVLRHIGRSIPVKRLSEIVPSPDQRTRSPMVDDLASQVMSWRLRGRAPTDRDKPFVDSVTTSLERALPHIRAVVEENELAYLVVPGGVYGTSGLYRLVGVESGTRVATVDADLNVAQTCVDGIAAQCEDIPRAFDALWNGDPGERSRAIAAGRAEFERRVQGRDRYGFQLVAAGARSLGTEGTGVLIPLNVEWDTSALGKHQPFTSTSDWLTPTIRELLDAGVEPIVVRQHPSERRTAQQSDLDIASLLTTEFGDDRRIRFVPADEPVSTYELMGSSRLVLPFVSTIGIEAAAIGKPVVVAGVSYYTHLGFVWSAASPEGYLDLLRRALAGELEPTPEQSDRAWACYYLTAVQNRVWTDFTPGPAEYWTWCTRSPASLFAEPGVATILEALDTNVPVSLLRHQRFGTDHQG